MGRNVIYRSYKSFSEVWRQSRKVGEAKAIANWLADNYASIITYARAQDDTLVKVSDADVFKKSIGVVTPFSKQARLIRTEVERL